MASYVYDAWGSITYQSGTMASVNPFRYRGYYYDDETGFYYLQSRYYDPSLCRFISADQYELLSILSDSLGELNLYSYCSNNPIMKTDANGKFAVSLTLIGLICGAIVGATVGGVMTYNVAKSNGAQGGELFGWTMAGILGGGIIGGALGAGVGALITKATGIIGLSITKYYILPIKNITMLGSMPGYITAANATGAGYYLISNQLWDKLSVAERWVSNAGYLVDSIKLGSNFVIYSERIVNDGSSLWYEIQFLIEHGIPWEMF